MTTKIISGEFIVSLAPIEGYVKGQQGIHYYDFDYVFESK